MITNPDLSLIRNCKIPESVKIMPFVNLYDSEFGEGCFVGPFVEVGGACIGKNTAISSGSYVCPLTKIGSECFISHGVQFCNDKFSDVPVYESRDHLKKIWKSRPVIVGDRVRIGSGAVILPGVKIGNDSIVGAGSVVVHDVPEGCTVAGNPAYIIKEKESEETYQYGELFQ